MEVANKYLETIDLPDHRRSIAEIFSLTHVKILGLAERMLKELKRLYYVTPTNYVELVKGYKVLLKNKQEQTQIEIEKLGSGLGRLDDAQSKSNELKKSLDLLQGELSRKSKDCDELFIKIERETREMNERKNEMHEREIMVEKEKKESEDLSDEAKQDLTKAEPALRAAEEGLANLTKDKLTVIKSYNTPPPGIDIVMNAVMILLGKEPSWVTAKKEMNDSSFMNRLKLFDKQTISTKTLGKLEKITSDPKMDVQKVDTLSEAAGGLWRWVRAIEEYAKAFKDIEPKRAKVKSLQEKLKKSEEELLNLRTNFAKLISDLEELNFQLEKAKSDKQSFEEEAKQLQIKLERA